MHGEVCSCYRQQTICDDIIKTLMHDNSVAVASVNTRGHQTDYIWIFIPQSWCSDKWEVPILLLHRDQPRHVITCHMWQHTRYQELNVAVISIISIYPVFCSQPQPLPTWSYWGEKLVFNIWWLHLCKPFNTCMHMNYIFMKEVFLQTWSLYIVKICLHFW